MDLVLCRPCGRITTELKDLMEDAELLKFYIFFANLEDSAFEQYIQLCFDCEKKLNAAFEFHKTCLTGETLRKFKPSPVKTQLLTPLQAKNTPVRVFARKVMPDNLELQESIENENSVSNVKRRRISKPAQDEISDVAECIESLPEDDGTSTSTVKRRIRCPICKMHVDQSELEYHINLHVLHIHKAIEKPKYPYIELPLDKNGKKRYQCQFKDCGAILTSWNVHMVKHFPELKTKMCSICGETFSQKIALEQHMNNHANFIPYQCDQCPQKFRRKPHLNSHIRAKHQNQRYVCKDCGNSYSLSVTFKFHVLLKHKGAKLVCDICKKTFNHRTAIDSHLRKVHQTPFDQAKHIVLPNNEKLLRCYRITEDVVFNSHKID